MIDIKRILICTTILTTVKAFLIPHIRLLQDIGYCVDVAGYKDVNELDEIVDNVYDIPYQRSPFSIQNFVASCQLKEIVRKNNYDLIHFHTPIASAFGRWTVKEFRKSGTKVIYTAHGFHFFKGAHFLNWLVYYPAERFLSRYTDILITINKEDYARAQTFKAKKVAYVPGVGLCIEKFQNVVVERGVKRAELGISNDAIVLLSVGEINENKNHATVIKALVKLNNPNISYVICGEGLKESYLRNLVRKFCLEKQVKLLGFRKDVAEICRVADIFAFPSHREGLGLAALEAMASGLPIITSNVHGIVDYSVDGETGFNCSPHDVEGFAEAIHKLIVNTELRSKMSSNNKKAVMVFNIASVKKGMEAIYSQL